MNKENKIRGDRRLQNNKRDIRMAWDDTIEYIRELEDKIYELEDKLEEAINKE